MGVTNLLEDDELKKELARSRDGAEVNEASYLVIGRLLS